MTFPSRESVGVITEHCRHRAHDLVNAGPTGVGFGHQISLARSGRVDTSWRRPLPGGGSIGVWYATWESTGFGQSIVEVEDEPHGPELAVVPLLVLADNRRRSP